MSNSGQIVGLFRKMKREIEAGQKLTDRDLKRLDDLLDTEQKRPIRSYNTRNKSGRTLLNTAEALANDVRLRPEQRMQAERIVKRLVFVNAKTGVASTGKPPPHPASQSRKASAPKRGGRTLRKRGLNDKKSAQ